MYRGYEFKSGLNTFVQKLLAVSGKNSFNVIFHGQGAATNCHSVIYLPEIRDDATLSRAKLERYTGYILHEWSHIQYTWSVHIENGHPNPAYLKQLWNALEDGWIEQRTINEGAVPNAARLFTALVSGIYREALAANIDWADPRQWPFALAVWSRKYVTIRPPVPVGVAAIFDNAVARPAQNTNDNLDIARWVYTQLRQYLQDNPNPQPQPDDGDSGGDSGEDSGDDSDDSQDGESDDSQDGESGDSQDGQPNDSQDGQPQDGQPNGHGGNLDSVDDPTAVEPTAEEHIESANEREQREVSNPWGSYEDIGGEHVSKPVSKNHALYSAITTPARLRYELNRLFDGSDTEQYRNGQRAGQVNTGALHRHSFDESVFRRRHEEEGIDTALYILIDVSGSTGGRPNGKSGPTIYQSEFAAAHSIIDALRGANVQIAVDAFASGLAQICDWGATVAKFKSNHAHAYGAAGGGTDDYTAVRHAHRRLLARPEKRKVLLVFSDGLGKVEYVKRQCDIGANLGITTIGIGIGVDVSGVYPQSVLVRDVSELASVSLRQIQLAA